MKLLVEKMKLLALLTTLALLGCKRSEPVAVPEAEPDEAARQFSIIYLGERMSRERYDKIRAEEQAIYREQKQESAREDWKRFETALEMTDFDWISEAFIAEKDLTGGVKLLKTLYGTTPHDLVSSITSLDQPGAYIALRINSRDKFEQSSVFEYQVSFQISDDHKYFYCVEPNDGMSVESLASRLKTK
jgi:hypothetical protein